MSTEHSGATHSVRVETGISREHICAAAEEHGMEPFALADCLRDLQQHLREKAERELGSWSGDGQVLLCAPEEQYLELATKLGGRAGWAASYLEAAQRAHILELEERKDVPPDPERDKLLLVQ